MSTKSECLERIRAESAYPVFRMFVNGVKYVTVGIAVVATMVAVLARDRIPDGVIMITIASSTVVVVVALVLADAFLMLADLADAAIDSAFHIRNGEAEAQPSEEQPT